MGWFDKVLGDDRQRAETKYAGRESATDKAARQRRQGHRRGIGKAAAQGQAWEERDRQRDRKGGWRRTTW
ncbi:hypothetical protein MQE23_08515 [Streptomyces sp. HP-A2021]|uniref:hypothetical protein n=1 Tax=Streptomyces sp. HP-A2021 TaxID=2927875 RepID=UPI001FAF89F0|nr:hypothetical protein [Streptomyces sp. HP-A2021]UOB09094.1 hypothetical protein MQE23_08515 [Streptomyces sp. HP-A2021]